MAAKIAAGIRGMIGHREDAEPTLRQRLADRAMIVQRVGMSERAAQTLHARS